MCITISYFEQMYGQSNGSKSICGCGVFWQFYRDRRAVRHVSANGDSLCRGDGELAANSFVAPHHAQGVAHHRRERSLPQIERWLKQADTLTSNIAVDGELSGKIRLASSTSFGFSQLIPAVNSFMQKHPKVHIDIDLQDSVSDLTEQRIDLAIRIASDPDPSLIGKPIAVCESVLVASPQYLQTHHAIAHPRDLSSHDCLGYKNFERHVWHLSQGDQFESVGIECRLTSNEATALLHGALQGMGISMLPTYLSNIYLQSGQLESVLPNWKPNDLNIYALYSSRKHLSPAVRAFIDHSEDYFKLHPW